MRKIDPSRYEPLYSSKSNAPKPDDIDVSDIVPLKPRPKKKPEKQKNKTTKKTKNSDTGTKASSNRDTMTPRYRDTTVSSLDDPTTQNIRQAVKKIGKEAATHRFTVEEKKAIAKILFTYQQDHDLYSSENEITRIAINYIVSEYQQNGTKSILHKALLALYR